MASGGMYGADHQADDKLLAYIADHIHIDNLPTLAKMQLEMTEVGYGHCIHGRNTAKEKISAVLQQWRNKWDIKVEDLLESISRWQKKGLIEPAVWETLEDHVDQELIETICPDVMPAHTTSTSGSLISLCCGICKRKEEPYEVPLEDISSVRSDTQQQRPELTEGLSSVRSDTQQQRPELTEEDKLIQECTKDSLEHRWRKFLSTDWLPADKSHKFSVIDYYTDVEWVEIKEKIRENEERRIKNIYSVFQRHERPNKAVNYLVLGEPGIGKSSSMVAIALNWVSGKELKHFDFAFLIPLREVNKNGSLEELVIENHQELSTNEAVSPEQIRSILYGRTGHHTLLLLDGYDEYRKGTNTEIDKAIQNRLGKTVLVLTSRPEAVENSDIKQFMSGIVKIKGLSTSKIEAYCDSFFENKEVRGEMLYQAQQVKIYNVLYIPIILLMTCVIYHEDQSLPKSQTKVFHAIYYKMISRSMHRLPEAERLSEDQIEELVYQLGRLSLEALKQKTHQTEISQTALNEVSRDIIKKLGILFAAGKGVSSTGETWYGFPHKTLQEFSAAIFLFTDIKKTETSKEAKEVLKKWFPSPDELKKHQQVIYFLCELLEDAPVQRQVLIEYVWKTERFYNLSSSPPLPSILPASAHHTESGHYYRNDTATIHTIGEKLSPDQHYRRLCIYEVSLPDLPGLPHSLQVLNLRYTELKDVSEVVRAVQRPTLRRVDLIGNGLGEEAVGQVLEAADTKRPRQKLLLRLYGEGLSQEFRRRWRRRCAGTQITLDWDP